MYKRYTNSIIIIIINLGCVAVAYVSFKPKKVIPFLSLPFPLFLFCVPSYAPYPPSLVCFSHSAERKWKRLLRLKESWRVPNKLFGIRDLA